MDEAAAEIAFRKRKKRNRIRLIILACLILIPILTYIETRIFQIGKVTLPISGNVLVFTLININVLLLLLKAQISGHKTPDKTGHFLCISFTYPNRSAFFHCIAVCLNKHGLLVQYQC
jgi:hypothetical protein